MKHLVGAADPSPPDLAHIARFRSSNFLQDGVMPETYEKHGIRFRYPEKWELSEEAADDTVCVTVAQSPGLFWTLTLFFDRVSPEEVVDTALQAFSDEYEELDVYPATAILGTHPCVAADIEFVALDLVNSAFVRACQTEDFTALVLYQGTDRDLKNVQETLEAISDSLELEADEAEWPDFARREDDNSPSDGEFPAHGQSTNGDAVHSDEEDESGGDKWKPRSAE